MSDLYDRRSWRGVRLSERMTCPECGAPTDTEYPESVGTHVELTCAECETSTRLTLESREVLRIPYAFARVDDSAVGAVVADLVGMDPDQRDYFARCRSLACSRRWSMRREGKREVWIIPREATSESTCTAILDEHWSCSCGEPGACAHVGAVLLLTLAGQA